MRNLLLPLTFPSVGFCAKVYGSSAVVMYNVALKCRCVVCICQTLGCHPIASLDHFQAEMLGTAESVEEVQTGDSKVVKVSSYYYRVLRGIRCQPVNGSLICFM